MTLQALKDEITRITNVTQYNEMDILNGTYYRNQVNTDNSTADDVSGVSIQTLDEVIKGTYILQDTLETSSSGQLVDANVTHTGGDSNISISADGDVAAGDYRLIRNNSGNIKLETTSDSGTTWTSASTETISADLAKNQILAQSATASYASPSISHLAEYPVALEISLLLRI